MHSIKRHYTRVTVETADITPIRLDDLEQPLVVVTVPRWDKISEKAMRFGMVMSKEVKVVNVQNDVDCGFDEVWDHLVMQPIRDKGLPEPELVSVQSTFRTIISPLMDYILKLEEDHPGRKVAVLLPDSC